MSELHPCNLQNAPNCKCHCRWVPLLSNLVKSTKRTDITSCLVGCLCYPGFTPTFFWRQPKGSALLDLWIHLSSSTADLMSFRKLNHFILNQRNWTAIVMSANRHVAFTSEQDKLQVDKFPENLKLPTLKQFDRNVMNPSVVSKHKLVV